MKKHFNAKKTFRKAVFSTIALRRFSSGNGKPEMSGEMKRLMDEVAQAKEDAESVSNVCFASWHTFLLACGYTETW
jgi:hypothetical protein